MTRKKLEKMTKDQLIEFALKLQNKMITKQTELMNGNKGFREKLGNIDSKFDKLKKKNETLKSKVSVAGTTSSTLSIKYE